MEYRIFREYDDNEELQHAFGKERANHKYIKREKGKNGKWVYYYDTDQLKKDFNKSTKKFKKGFNNTMDEIGDRAEDAYNSVKKNAKRYGNQVKETFKEVHKNSVKPRFSVDIGRNEDNMPAVTILRKKKGYFEPQTKTTYSVRHPKEIYEDVEEFATKTGKNIRKSAKKFKKGFNNTMDKIGDRAEDFYGDAKKFAKKTGKNIKKAANRAGDRIGDGVTGFRDKAGDVLRDTSKAIAPERKLSFKKKSKFEKAMNNARSKASDVLRDASRIVEPSLRDKADREFSRAGRYIDNTIDRGQQEVANVFKKKKKNRR